MVTRQQREALEYFRKHAGDWRSKAGGLDAARVNVIKQRNDYVLQVAQERPATRSSLDVGCGTGELVCRMAELGIEAAGVDYSPEMIDLASKKARDEGVPQARFVCSSIFDFEIGRRAYDLVSANGFIEYISPREMLDFFDRVAEALAPGGSFVVGSRNRLFNLVSMNEFTIREIEAGHIGLLLKEAVKWTAAGGMVPVDGAECAPLQASETVHANTGIEVATRFQYSPFQLIDLLRKRGLRAVEVFPVHIHGMTPSFSEANRELHVSVADLLQAHARRCTQLLVHASTFMLHVKKEG